MGLCEDCALQHVLNAMPTSVRQLKAVESKRSYAKRAMALPDGSDEDGNLYPSVRMRCARVQSVM